MKKHRFRFSMAARNAVKGYLFILPWLIGFIWFYVGSIVQTVKFSLSSLSVPASGGYTAEFVGFDNFIYAFTAHGTFKQTAVESLLNIIIDVPLIIFFSLFMAILLNRKFRGRSIVRAIFFLPVILGSGAIVDAMSLSASMMNGGMSTVSAEMTDAAASGVSISYYIQLFESLAVPTSVLEYLVGAINRLSDIVNASGVQIVIFIAALQAIPGSLYEVSRMEGATAYETFWKVTLPMVTPHIITCVVYTIVFRYADSEVVELAYQTAFGQFNYGLSAAFSLITTVVVGLLLIVVVSLIQKHTFYYD